MAPRPNPSETQVFFNRHFDRTVQITLVVVLVALAAGAALTLHAAWPSRIRKGYQPEQPIAYSHRMHAGVLQIRCRYCHYGVDSGAHAGVPALSVCMNCHGAFEPDPEKEGQVEKIGVLLKHWEQKKPVFWEKAHDLSDFAHFDHSRHAGAGLDCRNCHGPVETMALIKKRAPLTMGWCIACHSGRGEARLTEDALMEGKRSPKARQDPIYGKIRAPIHCSTCHR